MAAAVVALLGLAVLSWFHPLARNQIVTAQPTASVSHEVKVKSPPPVTPDPLLKRTRVGDITALRALEARGLTELNAEHCAAIGRGRARNRDWQGVIEAYGTALEKDPSLAKDEELVSDIHAAALNGTTSSAALRLAASRLGSVGADIIYDIWAAAASGRALQVDARSAKRLLDDVTVRRHASAALALALELGDARGCNDYRRLLPRVISVGDERCLRLLRRLTHDRGCGIFGLGDCYSCLRGGGVLSEAMEAARKRPGPAF
jgi:hypothetical protein